MTTKPNSGVYVSRELLEDLLTAHCWSCEKLDAANELRALLAQPADQQGEPVPYKQHPGIVGYARKIDLSPLLDETQPDGSHIYIGLDHPVCWAEEPPYDHLVPLYLQPATAKVDERAEFEKAIVDKAERFHPDLTQYGDNPDAEYRDANMEWAWHLWQARAKLNNP